MKLVINAVSAKMGGAVTYLTNVLHCLPSPETGDEFEVFLPPEAAEKQKGLADNVRLMPTEVGHAKWWKRLWWEQITLRGYLKKGRAEALFSPANFGMWHCPVRQILLVRQSLYFSRIYLDTFLPRHSFKTRVAFKLRRWLCRQSVRTADVVMTPTRAMLDDLRRFVEVSPEKAVVNPYGVAPVDSAFPEAKPVNRESRPETGSVIRLIYVSLYSDHKNLTTLLKAMPLLNRDGAGRFLLKTTVNPAWEGGAWTVTHKEDLGLARQPDVAPWVEFLGPLGKQQVQELYRGGDVFVFPSLCESFGHPMVEAMAHGLPIVASDTPVNREICGEAAVYFSPLSAEDLARHIARVAADIGLRSRLVAAGAQRAATKFRWREHVRRVLLSVQPDQSIRAVPM